MVYKLRESMLSASDGENSSAVETVILEEINIKPDDVKLRVRNCSSIIFVITINNFRCD